MEHLSRDIEFRSLRILNFVGYEKDQDVVSSKIWLSPYRLIVGVLSKAVRLEASFNCSWRGDLAQAHRGYPGFRQETTDTGSHASKSFQRGSSGREVEMSVCGQPLVAAGSRDVAFQCI